MEVPWEVLLFYSIYLGEVEIQLNWSEFSDGLIHTPALGLVLSLKSGADTASLNYNGVAAVVVCAPRLRDKTRKTILFTECPKNERGHAAYTQYFRLDTSENID